MDWAPFVEAAKCVDLSAVDEEELDNGEVAVVACCHERGLAAGVGRFEVEEAALKELLCCGVVSALGGDKNEYYTVVILV
jgi:hypothetical protein